MMLFLLHDKTHIIVLSILFTFQNNRTFIIIFNEEKDLFKNNRN